MKLKIYQVGEAVLRRKARALSREEILSPGIQNAIEWMRETMRDAPGVGLAAPQVGLPLQLAVVEDRAEYIEKLPPGHAAGRNRKPVAFHAIFNPRLTLEEEPPVEFFEGCLSLAGYTAIVPRAARASVQCLDHKAEPVTLLAEGWYARILQHEIDHLQGTLYIDRMRSRSFSTLDNYSRYGKDIPVTEYWNAFARDAE